MADNPHITGKYTIIAALIAAFATLGGIYLKHVLDSQKEKKQQIEETKIESDADSTKKPDEFDKPSHTSLDKKTKTNGSNQKENKADKKSNSTNISEVNEKNEDNHLPIEKSSFFLVLNSDQINGKIYIDGLPAKIISGQNTTYPEIEIEELGKEYSIQLINDKNNCKTSQYISSRKQKIYPCN